jgi:hypothetical protein
MHGDGFGRGRETRISQRKNYYQDLIFLQRVTVRT